MSKAKSKAKEPILLMLWGSKPGSLQFEFERRAVNLMNLKPGLFAINSDLTRYINPKVQWLWTQFQKGE